MSAAKKFAPCCGVLPLLRVPLPQQWMETTGGRVAADGYSWLQAVHWVVASGCYVPARSHGPREMGRTTVRLAQELAKLSPCRPGVEFLARKLRVTERTVEYHLSMLRESGLLAYIEIGTRYRGAGARASEFALVVPVEFDRALGIRTAGEGSGRRMTGIAEAGRDLMARMGAKAARQWRAARPKHAKKVVATVADTAVDQAAGTVQPPVSQDAHGVSGDDSRCTPMEGGYSVCTSDRPTLPPPESKLGSGEMDSSTGKRRQQERGAKPKRVLNRVGRRHQLAFELVQQVPWMTRAAVPRIAWIVRGLADAGWTCAEVLAWLDLRQEPSSVKRPSAFLAARLQGALKVADTTAKRQRLVAAWRDNRRATAARHQEWDGPWKPPSSQHVRALVHRAMDAPTTKTAGQDAPQHGPDNILALEDLTREEVLDMRTEAQKDPSLVWHMIEHSGEAAARRLFTNPVVDQLLRIPAPGTGTRMVVHGGWGQW